MRNFGLVLIFAFASNYARIHVNRIRVRFSVRFMSGRVDALRGQSTIDWLLYMKIELRICIFSINLDQFVL